MLQKIYTSSDNWIERSDDASFVTNHFTEDQLYKIGKDGMIYYFRANSWIMIEEIQIPTEKVAISDLYLW